MNLLFGINLFINEINERFCKSVYTGWQDFL